MSVPNSDAPYVFDALVVKVPPLAPGIVIVACLPESDTWTASLMECATRHTQKPTAPAAGTTVTFSHVTLTNVSDANDLWIADSNNKTVAFPATGVPFLTTPEPAGGTGVAIDSAGNVWSLNSGSNSVAEFTKTGSVTNSGYTGGGLTTPTALAIDGSGQVWIANSNNSISVFNSS